MGWRFWSTLRTGGGLYDWLRVSEVERSASGHAGDWHRSGDRSAGPRGRYVDKADDVLEGCRADSPGEMSGVPSAEFDRADVAHHIPGRASVGPFHQGAREPPPDAAVAHRPERRHPEVQERHVAQRHAD